jgi:hypothetical protein
MHLVAHCRKPLNEGKPPTKYDLRGSAAITDQAHNVVTVWANKGKSGSWEGKAGFWFDSASLRFCNDRGSIVEPYEMPHQSPLEA